MTLVDTCRMFQVVALRVIKGIVPIALVGFVLILSLFAGAIISSIFVHAVEF